MKGECHFFIILELFSVHTLLDRMKASLIILLISGWMMELCT